MLGSGEEEEKEDPQHTQSRLWDFHSPFSGIPSRDSCPRHLQVYLCPLLAHSGGEELFPRSSSTLETFRAAFFLPFPVTCLVMDENPVGASNCV